MLGVFRKPGEGYSESLMGMLVAVLYIPALNSGSPMVYYAEPSNGFVHNTCIGNVCIREISSAQEREK